MRLWKAAIVDINVGCASDVKVAYILAKDAFAHKELVQDEADRPHVNRRRHFYIRRIAAAIH